MEYEKYRNQLSFWFDQYGVDFLNFLSKYNIDLEEDKYSFLSVTTANRTVIIEYCDTIEKFEEFFNKLRAKNSSINFRYPPYQLKSIINDPKKTVPVSEEDFSPLDLFQEIKSLRRHVRHSVQSYSTQWKHHLQYTPMPADKFSNAEN